MDYRRRRLSERISAQLGLALLVIATALIQATLLPTFLRASLNLVLVATVVGTMLRGTTHGATVAFYAGLTLDVLAHTPLGTHILPLLLAAAITSIAMERFPAENWLLTLLLVGISTPLYHLLVVALSGGTRDWLAWLLIVPLPALVINLVLALPEYLALQWWHERRSMINDR